MESLQLVIVVGSLRARSVNGAVARAVQSAVPAGVSIQAFDVSGVPLYNGDVEEVGLPDSVAQLHDAVGDCDGIVFCSPEYNGSFPAVTKNVIDWLSRPPRRWDSTPVTMISATPGPRAGLGVRGHFTQIMDRQPVRLYETHGIGSAGDKLDESGELADAHTLAELTSFVAAFTAFCRAEKAD